MSGKFTAAKLMLLGLSVGLIPCLASALDMPRTIAMEQVDTSHLGEVQEGVMARRAAGWTAQVGAYADRDKAMARLDQVAQLLPRELADTDRGVTTLKWDDTRTLYRARFTGLSHEAAAALCASLNRSEQACFVSPDDKAAGTRIEAAREPVDDAQAGGFAVVKAPDTLISPADALHETLLLPVPSFSAAAEPAGAEMATADTKFAKASLRVSNDELSGMRGGFFTAAGAQFDFGASIKTMVNGQLALQTNLTWTPQGANIASLSGLGQQIASQVQANLANAGITGNANNPAVTMPASLANLGNAASNAASNPTGAAAAIATPTTSLATNTVSDAVNSAADAVASAPAQAAAPASAPSSAANTPQTTVTIPTVVTGVNIPSASGGSTQILNNISANQIQSIILNSASGQTINQNTNVTLTIYNLQQWQQQLAQHALSAQLANEVMAASGFAH
jgi:hypothetical protein